MSDKRFPVLGLWGFGKELQEQCPKSVPWQMLAPHEDQAVSNHSQSLNRLAQRGGLSPCEMLAVLEDRCWHKMSDEDSVRGLVEAVRKFKETERGE